MNLKTIPSCELHNNGKSHDDQYAFAHICTNAARGDNLPGTRFQQSILPQLDFPRFRHLLTDGAHPVQDGVAYPIDQARLDNFFDALTCAAFFCEFDVPLDENVFSMGHAYLSLHSKDPEIMAAEAFLRSQMAVLFEHYRSRIKTVESAKIDEVVYGHKIMAPRGLRGSITIGHTFYGSFEVVSLLTHSDGLQSLIRDGY